MNNLGSTLQHLIEAVVVPLAFGGGDNPGLLEQVDDDRRARHLRLNPTILSTTRLE